MSLSTATTTMKMRRTLIGGSKRGRLGKPRIETTEQLLLVEIRGLFVVATFGAKTTGVALVVAVVPDAGWLGFGVTYALLAVMKNTSTALPAGWQWRWRFFDWSQIAWKECSTPIGKYP